MTMNCRDTPGSRYVGRHKIIRRSISPLPNPFVFLVKILGRKEFQGVSALCSVTPIDSLKVSKGYELLITRHAYLLGLDRNDVVESFNRCPPL
jgi:hypothetical protein